MGGLVLREDRRGAAILTLNRPDKLNALNVELFVELDAHVRKLATETETVGLVIVKGAGRCFSAGHDLSDIAAGEKLPEPFRTFSKFNPIFYLIDGFRYGFIGRAEGSLAVGATMTGGLVLALGFVCFRMFQTGYKIKT